MKGRVRARDRRKNRRPNDRCTTWQLVVDAGTHPDGRRKQIYQPFSGTRTKADAALRKLVAEVEQGILCFDDSISLSQWVEIWIEHKRSGSRAVRESTLLSYSSLLKQHVLPVLGAVRLSKLAYPELQALFDEQQRSGNLSSAMRNQPLSIATVRRILQAVRACLKHAVRSQLIANNPAELVELARVPTSKKAKALDVAQGLALIAAARGTRLEIPVLIALILGIRRGEIFGLQWGDIDLAGSKIQVQRQAVRGGRIAPLPKTDSGEREVPLPPFLVTALRAHKAKQSEHRLYLGLGASDSTFVNTDERGDHVNPDGISTLYKRIVRDAGVPTVRFHDLRHSTGSILIAAGVPLPNVARILGHSDPSVTMKIYAHGLDAGHEMARDVLERLFATYPPDGTPGLSVPHASATIQTSMRQADAGK